MIYIILPTYNEKENLASLVESIMILSLSIKIIIVDDDSPDGTGKLADELAKQYPIDVIHRTKKSGIGSAYLLGFHKALTEGAEYIMEMDADWSHNPNDIPNLVEQCQQGVDLAIGSRRVVGGKIVGWGSLRQLMSRGAMDFSRFILNLKTLDVTAGFRCYRSSMLERLPLDKINSNGYSFQEELVFLVERLGGKVREIPVIFNDRRYGKSKLSFCEVIKFFYVILLLKIRDVKKYY